MKHDGITILMTDGYAIVVMTFALVGLGWFTAWVVDVFKKWLKPKSKDANDWNEKYLDGPYD